MDLVIRSYQTRQAAASDTACSILTAVHGFFEEGLLPAQRHLLFQQLIAVAGHIQHLEIRIVLARPPRKLGARHLRHDDVCQQQVESAPPRAAAAIASAPSTAIFVR